MEPCRCSPETAAAALIHGRADGRDAGGRVGEPMAGVAPRRPQAGAPRTRPCLGPLQRPRPCREAPQAQPRAGSCPRFCGNRGAARGPAAPHWLRPRPAAEGCGAGLRQPRPAALSSRRLQPRAGHRGHGLPGARCPQDRPAPLRSRPPIRPDPCTSHFAPENGACSPPGASLRWRPWQPPASRGQLAAANRGAPGTSGSPSTAPGGARRSPLAQEGDNQWPPVFQSVLNQTAPAAADRGGG
jgi:hypothetical protein